MLSKTEEVIYNPRYKRIVCPKEFWFLADKYNIVLEHRLVWQINHPNECLLKSAIIHHVNGDILDNRIENLEPMSRSGHTYNHNKKDMSNRLCLICKQNTTPYEYKTKTYYRWIHYKKGFICTKCYMKKYNRDKR